jgi:S-adenosylmethionine hydrolase
MELPVANGIVALLTDFGVRDPYVGTVKGMVKRSNPRAELIDLCHDVPGGKVQLGALLLAAAVDRFPVGTVHLAVVDLRVETDRRVLAACARRCYWIGPDNGILGAVLGGDPEGEVRAVDLERLGLETRSSTSPGRDVLAPLAGLLSSGHYGFRALGPRVSDPVVLPSVTEGEPRIIHVDHYGNLITNLRAEPGLSELKVGARRIPVMGRYEDAADGDLLALVNSYDLLEISVRNGNAAATLGTGPGAPIERGGG